MANPRANDDLSLFILLTVTLLFLDTTDLFFSFVPYMDGLVNLRRPGK